ncbi:MAG: hypothetical protein LBH16_10145 [Treponema sp.]|nr:hypothetical protein [Treponema sp.]
MPEMDIQIFINDDRVQGIIERDEDRENNGGGNEASSVSISVDLTAIDEGEPRILINGTPANKGDSFTIHYSADNSPRTVTVSLANADDYSVIKWYCENMETPLHSGSSFTAQAASPPFDTIGDKLLTVITEYEDDVMRSSYMVIAVEL